MAQKANLDALIPREDFSIKASGAELPDKPTIQIFELEPNSFFYQGLRKPDFQRETAEWDPDRVVGLIRTFLSNDLIPSVILWQHHELLFVIDGSHRLSALIAWVQDDYGAGTRSQGFFDHQIPRLQKEIADNTRRAVEREFGSFQDHKNAIANPLNYGADMVARARSLATLSVRLQWVKGDSTKAEEAFNRINQKAVNITPQERQLLETRKKPNTMAARAILRRGTGHQYWSSFGDDVQKEIRNFATEVHGLMFNPALRYPITTLDLPSGGAESAATALRTAFDFVGLCNNSPSDADDDSGARTISALTLCRKFMRVIISNHESSLGLHPAVYFYSWSGKHQPILFLTMAEIIIELERKKQLPSFIKRRARLEDFLIGNRTLINQVVRKYGTKDSGHKHVAEFYQAVFELIDDDVALAKLPKKLKERFGFLNPDEVTFNEDDAPETYSGRARAGLVMAELLKSAQRCPICGGHIPSQSVSSDHRLERSEGGRASSGNWQMTHPYCNTARPLLIKLGAAQPDAATDKDT